MMQQMLGMAPEGPTEPMASPSGPPQAQAMGQSIPMQVQGTDGPGQVDVPAEAVEAVKQMLLQVGVPDDGQGGLQAMAAAVLNAAIDPQYAASIERAVQSGQWPDGVLVVLNMFKGGGQQPQQPPQPGPMEQMLGGQPPAAAPAAQGPQQSPLDRMMGGGGY